jgi:hypothetical protein
LPDQKAFTCVFDRMSTMTLVVELQAIEHVARPMVGFAALNPSYRPGRKSTGMHRNRSRRELQCPGKRVRLRPDVRPE